MIITVDGDTPREHFTIVPNAIMRDGSLSFKAKGVLTYLLGHERGYSLSVLQLAQESSDGDSAVRAAIHELEDAGLLTRTRTRDESGRLSEVAYIVTVGRFATRGFSTCGQQITKEDNTTEDQGVIGELDISQKDIERDADFDTFWAAYPLKVGKPAAEKSYRTARRRAKPASILAGLGAACEAWKGSDERFIPHPATWLNQDRWGDVNHPKRGNRTASLDDVIAKLRERESENEGE